MISIAKYLRLSVLNDRNLFFCYFECLKNQDQSVGRIGFSEGPSLWHVDNLSVSLHDLFSAHVYIIISSTYKDINDFGLALFNLNYLVKGSITKYSHILI